MTLDDQFERDHAPGPHAPADRRITASAVAGLVLPPDQLPSWANGPYALAAHLTGEAPIVVEGEHLEIGKALEPLAIKRLASDHGIEVVATQPRFDLQDERILAYPDGLCADSALLEIKWLMRGEHALETTWADGPPPHVLAQVHHQMVTSSHKMVRVAAVILSTVALRIERIEVFEVYVDTDASIAIIDACRAFHAILDAGEMPAPDASESSYRAMVKALDIKPEKRVKVTDPNYSRRASNWRQAIADRIAAEKVEAAQRLAFSTVAGDAEIIDLSDGTEIKRKSVTRRAVPNPKPQPASSYWRWSP